MNCRCTSRYRRLCNYDDEHNTCPSPGPRPTPTPEPGPEPTPVHIISYQCVATGYGKKECIKLNSSRGKFPTLDECKKSCKS